MLTVAVMLAQSTHPPLLALPPGCGGSCAGLTEHDSALISVVHPGIRCVRGSGLSGGMLRCHAGGGDAQSTATSFVVDPDDPEQLSQILADGALRDQIMVSDWLKYISKDLGSANTIAHEHHEAKPNSGTLQPPTVAWLRECGCSGLHREATHFVAPLSKLFARDVIRTGGTHKELRDRMFTNSCPEDCGFSAEINELVDAVAVPIGAFWRMAELVLRHCGARVGQLRAVEHLNAPAKQKWGCTTQTSAALQLVVHVGPERAGGGPCAWPEEARWLRHAPNTVTISRTMFEVNGLLDEAVERCNQYDEVWVPASFNLRTFQQSGVSVDRLRSLPEGFDAAIFHASAENGQGPPNQDHGIKIEKPHASGAVDWAALALETPQQSTEKTQDREGATTHEQQQQEENGADNGQYSKLPTEIRNFITGDPVRQKHPAPASNGRSFRRAAARAIGLPSRPGGEAITDERPQFVFLSVFKWEARKGWQNLLAAFWAEFLDPLSTTTLPRVRLIIKTSMPLPPDENLMHHSDRPVHQVAAWAWELGYDVSDAMAMVLVYEGMLSSHGIGELYRSVDSFVLATHGEGWGLPLLEAMACGLPTIATAWGGHIDFMGEGRGLLVGIEETLVRAPPEEFGGGFKWAQPRHDLLRHALRTVSEQGSETKKVARRGWAWVHERLQYDDVAQLAVRMLKSAAGKHGRGKTIIKVQHKYLG